MLTSLAGLTLPRKDWEGFRHCIWGRSRSCLVGILGVLPSFKGNITARQGSASSTAGFFKAKRLRSQQLMSLRKLLVWHFLLRHLSPMVSLTQHIPIWQDEADREKQCSYSCSECLVTSGACNVLNTYIAMLGAQIFTTTTEIFPFFLDKLWEVLQEHCWLGSGEIKMWTKDLETIFYILSG